MYVTLAVPHTTTPYVRQVLIAIPHIMGHKFSRCCDVCSMIGKSITVAGKEDKWITAMLTTNYAHTKTSGILPAPQKIWRRA